MQHRPVPWGRGFHILIPVSAQRRRISVARSTGSVALAGAFGVLPVSGEEDTRAGAGRYVGGSAATTRRIFAETGAISIATVG